MPDCTDPECRAHGELVRLRLLRARVMDLHDLLERWDVLSKGETMTTHQIRKILGGRDNA